MAEKVEGLSARLKFEGAAAILGMDRTSKAFKRLGDSAQTLGAGVQNVKKGFAGMGIAAAAVGVGIGASIKKFATFDGQMATVKAVLGEARRKDFPALTAEAEKLGATTKFTATQAAEAMEELARAGLGPKKVLSSIGPVLAGAAADGIDLATAAKINVSAMAQFGLKASDSTRIMDTLAFVSRNTKSNMIALSEGMKFVGLKATAMKIPFEDTIASLGALNDVGLDATLAGTALKNMMVKMAANAKRGRIGIRGFNFAIKRTNDGQLDLNATMQDAVVQLAKIPGDMKRAQIATQLFGIRGESAFLAFKALTKVKTDILFKNLAKNAKGTAKEMARMQLDSLQGKFTLLSSAVDGFMTRIGRAFSPEVTGLANRLMGGLGKNSKEFISGLKEGIQGAKSIFSAFISTLKGAGRFVHGLLGPLSPFGADGAGVKGFTSLAVKAAAFGLSIKLVTKLLGRMASVAKGSFQIIKGSLGFLKVGAGGLMGFLTKKFPALTKVLPRGLDKLAKGVGAIEKITAQPVRVVNFDEAGGIGGGAGGVGGGAGAGAGQAAAGGGFFTKAINAKSIGGIAKIAGGVAVAGTVGWQIGRGIAKALGTDKKLADAGVKSMLKMTGREELNKSISQQRATLSGFRQIAAFRKLRQSGIEDVRRGDKKQAITRELVRARVLGTLKGRSQEEIALVMKQMLPALQQFKTAADVIKEGRPLEVIVKVDGREIGKAAATAKDEAAARGAKPSATPKRLRSKSR